MRTLIRYVLSSLLLLLLAGCQSSQDPTTGTTRVSGQVVQGQGRQPLPYASVQVWHASAAQGYLPVGSPYPSDAQGNFRFDFTADYQSGYIVTATAPPGYLTDWQAAPALKAGRANDHLTIPTLAPAWVKLKLVDTPPKSRVGINLSGYDGSSTQLYYPRDTTLIRPCTANFTRKIIWIITDAAGVNTQYSQDISPSALDTVTVRIPF